MPFFQGDRKFENDPDNTPDHGLESGCGICVVEIEGYDDLMPACVTPVVDGMRISASSKRAQKKRKENIAKILADHPHACLTCAQKEGCSRTQCSSNVPEEERCCPQFGHCELQKVAEYIGIKEDIPRWTNPGEPKLDTDPLFERDYNLCISCTRCVRACRDLRGINALGFVFDFDGKLKIGSVAPGLKESGCKFCTACVEVCPTGAILDKVRFTGDRESVLLPCVNACPVGIDIPWYLRFVSQGKCDEALAVIRENVPFPGILGRVCIHPCEDACRRGEVNEPVSICALKRYAADHAKSDPMETLSVLPNTGKRVAVVGAGPGGLSAAYYIRKKGHAVTVYDSMNKPGGMMRYGIPRHRLPEELLDREIGAILDLGIDFRSEESIGNGISLKDLKSDYDAVFLSTGAQLSRKLDIDGSDSPAVMWGIDFLREVAAGIGPELKGTVVVIGGGNVAIDVALTSRRLGAERVGVVCLEKRKEMPAHDWEIAQAEDEGIIIHNSWGPKSISTSRNGISGIECKECTAVFDEEGYFHPPLQ